MTDETTISHRRNLVTIRNLKKIYRTEDGEKVALHDVNLNITKREHLWHHRIERCRKIHTGTLH